MEITETVIFFKCHDFAKMLCFYISFQEYFFSSQRKLKFVVSF